MNKKVKFIENPLSKYSFINIEKNPDHLNRLNYGPANQNSLEKDETVVNEIGETKYLSHPRIQKRDEYLNYSKHLFENGNKSAGRGFGCLKNEMDLRKGVDSRKREKDASYTDIIDYQIGKYYFNNHNNNVDNLCYSKKGIQNPQSAILQRGGIDTRNLDKYRKN